MGDGMNAEFLTGSQELVIVAAEVEILPAIITIEP